MTMDEMLAKEDLIQEKSIQKKDADGNVIEAIYLQPFYYAEIGVAGKLKKLATFPATDRLWTGLMKARAESGNQNLSVDVEAIEKKVEQQQIKLLHHRFAWIMCIRSYQRMNNRSESL